MRTPNFGGYAKIKKLSFGCCPPFVFISNLELDFSDFKHHLNCYHMKQTLSSLAAALSVLLVSNAIAAQTNIFPSTGSAGIGTITPNTSSVLDMVSTTQGVLVPRMTQAQRNNILSPAVGLLIFQTTNTPGFYYYSDKGWTALTPKAKGWLLTGNAGTTPGTNFIGTTDAQPLVFKVNNQQTGAIGGPGENTAFGYLSLTATTGVNNTANGSQALRFNTTGSANTAAGAKALDSNDVGHDNTASGYAALIKSHGSYNTANGSQALSNNLTGNNNTALGYRADIAGNNLSNATAIGNGTVVQQSNTIKFGNENVWGWGFGNDPVMGKEALVVGVAGSLVNGNGAYLTQTGVWTNSSSKEFKEDFTQQDLQSALARICKLSITKWRFKGSDEYHIGPLAEEFYDAFKVGTNNKSISTVDPAGVALLGIQALAKNQDDLAAKNQELKTQIMELKKLVTQLQEKLNANLNSTAISLTEASLEQNVPNPFNHSTTIHYTLPQVYSSAKIIITDAAGKTLKDVIVSGKGKGSLQVDASSITSGAYQYSLVIDGRVVDTKRMEHLK